MAACRCKNDAYLYKMQHLMYKWQRGFRDFLKVTMMSLRLYNFSVVVGCRGKHGAICRRPVPPVSTSSDDKLR